jgi:hypothetical protein
MLRMGRSQPIPTLIKEQTSERAGMLRVFAVGSVLCIAGQYFLHLIPKHSIDDGIMLASVDLTFVENFAQIGSIAKNVVKWASG